MRHWLCGVQKLLPDGNAQRNGWNTRYTVFRRIAISTLLLFSAGVVCERTRPQYGGTLRLETQLDPWQGVDGIARRLTMDGLTRLDAAGAVKPALTVEWSSQSVDHRWEFRIRSNVHF